MLIWPMILMSLAGTGHAGKLEDFERDATEKKQDGDERPPEKQRDDDRFTYAPPDDSESTALLMAVILPLHGATQSWARVTGEALLAKELLDLRRAGEATLPFARVDVAYQVVESDVDAWDVRGEIGFGPFAIQGRETHYQEEQPRDTLDVVQAHALLRMTFIEGFEIDLGLGGHVVAGKGTSSGVSGTVPVLIHPWDFLGLEFRPAWAGAGGEVIQDYDLSVFGGWRFVSVRAGYRWTRAGGSSLDGPIIGLAARW